METKICKKCEKDLDISFFVAGRVCKACVYETHKKKLLTDPEYARKRYETIKKHTSSVNFKKKRSKYAKEWLKTTKGQEYVELRRTSPFYLSKRKEIDKKFKSTHKDYVYDLSKKHYILNKEKMSKRYISDITGIKTIDLTPEFIEMKKKQLILKKKVISESILVNLETGIFYTSVKEAAVSSNIYPTTLKNWLTKTKINKSNFIYC